MHVNTYRSIMLLAIMLLGLFAGCAHQAPLTETYQAYDGAPRDEREVATIYAVFSDPQKGYGGLHGKIDYIDSTWITLTRAAPLDVKVMPGPHKLKMTYGNGGGAAAGVWINVTVQAGHTYEVKSEIVGGGVRSWVEDKGLAYTRTDWTYQQVHH